MSGCQFCLQVLVFAGSRRVGNEVVAKEQSVPVFVKRAAARDHVDVVGADAAFCALDEEGIPRRNIIAVGRPPKVVVALSAKNRSDLGASRPQAGDLHEHVNDRLGGETRNRRAAEMLDPADKTLWNASKQ